MWRMVSLSNFTNGREISRTIYKYNVRNDVPGSFQLFHWPNSRRFIFLSSFISAFDYSLIKLGYLPSCSYYKKQNQRLPNGHYTIDPDGHGPEKPFRVYCDMRDKNGAGVTLVGHDSESDIVVDNCEPKGCFSHSVTYPGANEAQFAKLTNLSTHCEQFIKYLCKNTEIGLKGGNAWLESRSGAKMDYWGGATPGSNKCACGMKNSCASKKAVCNCDMNDEVLREDSGLLTHKFDLPVSKLRFGDIGYWNEKGIASLGKLKCYGIEACRTNPCLNGGTCKVMAHGGSTCVCQSGFTGRLCQQDVDECADEKVGKCGGNGVCQNTLGSFKCVCKSGFKAEGAKCVDIDECKTILACGKQGKCQNNPGSYKCTCNKGYRQEGKFCRNIDECSSGQSLCDKLAWCIDNPGSYKCHCRPGYKGDGMTCTDINECAEVKGVCGNSGLCVNIQGSYKCQCNDGYKWNGKACRDIDECLMKDKCGRHGTCVNLQGSHKCVCGQGFKLENGICEDMDECADKKNNDCKENSICVNTIGYFECKCNEGFMANGDKGCIDIDECKTVSCQSKAVCKNTPGSYKCACKDGYKMSGKVCKNVDECSEGVCDKAAWCSDSEGSYKCKCKLGYSGDGHKCTDIDECTAGKDQCKNGARCINTHGSYRCQCKDGYEWDGTACSDVDECSMSYQKCGRHGVCINLSGSYQCKCKRGYRKVQGVCQGLSLINQPGASAKCNAAWTSVTLALLALFIQAI